MKEHKQWQHFKEAIDMSISAKSFNALIASEELIFKYFSQIQHFGCHDN